MIVMLHAAGLKGSTALSQAIITGADRASPLVGCLQHERQNACMFHDQLVPYSMCWSNPGDAQSIFVLQGGRWRLWRRRWAAATRLTRPSR